MKRYLGQRSASQRLDSKADTGPSLLARISAAESPEHVRRLLAEGATYVNAGRKTKERWKHAAEARIKALEGA